MLWLPAIELAAVLDSAPSDADAGSLSVATIEAGDSFSLVAITVSSRWKRAPEAPMRGMASLLRHSRRRVRAEHDLRDRGQMDSLLAEVAEICLAATPASAAEATQNVCQVLGTFLGAEGVVIRRLTADMATVDTKWISPECSGTGPAIGHRSSMDRLVFDQAADLAARLSPSIGVSVNVSAGSLMRTSVPQVLDSSLRRYGVAPQRVTVEVIEDEMVDEHSTARAVLSALGELGVGIAIDDFGTGHSSLARLRRLPVTSLKIDRSFIMAMAPSEDDLAIVSAVSELGRALDLLTVAEGVETIAVKNHMVERGVRVDRLQGYGIARPMPTDQLVEWINGPSVDADRSTIQR